MSDEEFDAVLEELRGDWLAPSELAELTARLLATLRAENKQLARKVWELQESVNILENAR